jgi:hypothetical protein
MSKKAAVKESVVERRLRELVKQLGGKAYKFISPGEPGVPDRLLLLPGGVIIFVETKTTIGHTQAIQDWQIDEMRKRGADVRVVRGLDEVKAFISEIEQNLSREESNGDERRRTEKVS